MPLIDLTAELAHHMVRYPLPHVSPVEVVPVATHETTKRSVQRVTFVTHVSTHIDAPFHAIPDGITIERIPLDILIGPSALVRIPGHDRQRPIDAIDLSPHTATFAAHRRVTLDSGWARAHWGTTDYFTEGPYLTRDAARFLAGFDLRLMAMDFPNIDSVEDTKPGIAAPNHNVLLGKGMVFVENLLNLHLIPGPVFKLIALPLRLIGGDGCPCRVVAEFHEDVLP